MTKYLMKNKNRKILMTYLWLEGILFFLIKWTEASRPFSVYGKVEYSAIVLNFCVMVYIFIQRWWDSKKNGSLIYSKDIVNRGQDWTIPLALTITLLADYYLTLTGTHFNRGVFCFILVQIIYGMRIGYDVKNVFLRVSLFMIFAVIMYFLKMPLSFSTLCGLSIGTLLGNIYAALQKWNSSRNRLDGIFAIGLLLFAGCDLSLGLTFITEGMVSLQLFHDIIKEFVWLFYVPSQVLITLTFFLERE